MAWPPLEAGKDVLLEKPMAITVAECDRLLHAAERSRRVLSIGHELRVSTQWALIKRMLDAGEIGAPLYALVSLFRFPYRPGAGGWRYAADRVGSWILEEPVHFFDFVMWYFEALGDPTSVLAVGNSKRRAEGMYDDFSTRALPRACTRYQADAAGSSTITWWGSSAPRARSARGGRPRTRARSSPPTS